MVKTRARSMKAIAVVALGFLFAGVAATAATADPLGKVFVCKYVGTPGDGERLQTGNNPISVSVNAIPDYQGVGSYFADAQGRSYVLAEDDSTGGGQSGEPSVSKCPAPNPGPDPVTPVALTVNDLCGVENDSITGVPADNRYSGPTVNENMQSVTFTPGEGQKLGSPLPSGWTAGEGGVATFSHTFSNEPCVSETQFVTIIWNMNPVGTPPVWDPAQTIVDHKVTSTPELGAFDDLLVGKCVGFQVDVYRYTTEADKAAVDNLISVGILTGPGSPPEPLIEGGYGVAWKFYQDSDCAQEPEVVAPAFPEPIAPQCDADGSLPALPTETASIKYTWDESDPNMMIATAKGGFVFAGDKSVVSHTYNEPGSATGYQSSDSEGDCYTEQPDGESGETVLRDGQCTVPADGTYTTVTTRTPWTQEYELNTVTGVWTLGAKVDGTPVVTDSKADNAECAVDIELAEVKYAPTWTPICLPNNDTVDFPDVVGVTYTDTGWVLGKRTITAAADEGFTLLGEKSWTFTDTPAAGCPDEIGFSSTPPKELAYTGASSTTNGLTALAIFLMATGTMLVGLKTRAVK